MLHDILNERLNAEFKAWHKARNRALNPDEARANLLALKGVLDKHKCPFYLAFGTLLGAVRNKGFIPGDHDTDIIIHERDEAALCQALLSPELAATGLAVSRLVHDLASLSKGNEYVDIYVFRGKGDVLHCCDTYEIESWRLDHPERQPFLGTDFLAPGNPMTYLDERYPNWIVPRNECTRL